MNMMIKCFLLFSSLFAVSNLYAEPIKFSSYRNDSGATVFSNVPKECISNGFMKCSQYYLLKPKHTPNIGKNNSPLIPLSPKLIKDRKLFTAFPNMVKKSKSDICHSFGSEYYDRTISYTSYPTIKDCLDSGGRLPM